MHVSEMKNKYSHLLMYFVVFIPAIVYFAKVSPNAVNVPSLDDFGAILEFLSRYKTTHGIDRFWLLFSQHNEHRIFTSRVIYVTYYSLFGTINFRHIVFLGNFELVLIYVLLLSFAKKIIPRYFFIAALVAGISLFDLCNWENANFAMACVQNYGIFLWLILSLFFYSKPGKGFMYLGLLFQVLCIFSSGNGVVAAGVIALFNVLSLNKTKSVLSIAGLVLFAPMYFIHYTAPSTGHPATDIVKIAVFFFNMLGADIIFEHSAAGVVAGIIKLSLFLLAIPLGKKILERKDAQPVLCIALFVIASIGVTAVFRCNVAGVPPNSSRYMIYPHMLTTLIFILLAARFQDRKLLIPVAIAFTIAVSFAYKINFRWGSDNLAGLHNSMISNEFNFPDKEAARRITNDACRLDIYCIDKFRQLPAAPLK